MKVDDVTLQNILKTYGKDNIKKNIDKPQKKAEDKEKKGKRISLGPQDLKVVNYNKKGILNIEKDKKQALIDFFQ